MLVRCPKYKDCGNTECEHGWLHAPIQFGDGSYCNEIDSDCLWFTTRCAEVEDKPAELEAELATA